MREPQVVRRARVQKMSLCAIGMPVSGSASPRARRASARSAAASACGASALMKAFSSPLWRSMRSRQARVSSTEDSFLAARAAESSRSVAVSKLLDHLGYEVQPILHLWFSVPPRWSDRLIKLALIGLAHPIRPQALNHVERMGHRLDTGGVNRAHLVDQAEHPVQAIEHGAGFFWLDRDAREAREAPHVVGG